MDVHSIDSRVKGKSNMNERGDTRRKAEPMTKVPLLEDLLRGVDFDFILVL
jgi:hypothetical protein